MKMKITPSTQWKDFSTYQKRTVYIGCVCFLLMIPLTYIAVTTGNYLSWYIWFAILLYTGYRIQRSFVFDPFCQYGEDEEDDEAENEEDEDAVEEDNESAD